MRHCKKRYLFNHIFEDRWAAPEVFLESITQVKTMSIVQASTPRNPWAFTHCCGTHLLTCAWGWRGAPHMVCLFPPPGRGRGTAETVPRPLCVSDLQKSQPPSMQTCLSTVTFSQRRFSTWSRQKRLFHERKTVNMYRFGACCPTRPPMCAWGDVIPWLVPILPLSANLGEGGRAELRHGAARPQMRGQPPWNVAVRANSPLSRCK